ncbi:alpha/beta fold hydrolase [Duganella violaceipulchra]|uniref:Alpha/beta hydrolase n=1 Tax=Duganella violaceipulchra TaxID=2849652 RepID=A0AA41HCB1_9BURK|nr:alpha/beta hydrolase [Duganella violaceicalia]MBV6321128.1 alpha/beta hydrolase [Duganella violaceicalia]MCP2009627.1 pimeloyl-ACP methyl ester carboxylesterase [Duganella violaceicalia]
MNTSTKMIRRSLAAATLVLSTGLAAAAAAPIDVKVDGFADQYAQVNGVRLHYKIGGHGSPVVLLHGYGQTGHMWTPAMAELVKHHTVIVPDLRGAGGSEKPAGGYDKKTMAVDIHELVKGVSSEPAAVVGHDIGLMVAYGYAAQFPADTSKLVLMDAFIPGVGDWRNAFPAKAVWHFHFYGETPLALVQGRERIYFEHFWNDFSADKTKSVKEADRKLYTAAYAQPGGMRAGFAYFSDFERDAADFGPLSQTKLSMPVLTLAGQYSAGEFLGKQVGTVATNVKSVIVQGSGHWLIDEAPGQVVPALVEFIDL